MPSAKPSAARTSCSDAEPRREDGIVAAATVRDRVRRRSSNPVDTYYGPGRTGSRIPIRSVRKTSRFVSSRIQRPIGHLATMPLDASSVAFIGIDTAPVCPHDAVIRDLVARSRFAASSNSDVMSDNGGRDRDRTCDPLGVNEGGGCGSLAAQGFGVPRRAPECPHLPVETGDIRRASETGAQNGERARSRRAADPFPLNQKPAEAGPMLRPRIPPEARRPYDRYLQSSTHFRKSG